MTRGAIDEHNDDLAADAAAFRSIRAAGRRGLANLQWIVAHELLRDPATQRRHQIGLDKDRRRSEIGRAQCDPSLKPPPASQRSINPVSSPLEEISRCDRA